jgi:regulatory protein
MPNDESNGAPPDAASLHAAAVSYLSRYSATRATLSRALNRIVDRWLRTHGGPDAPAIAAVAKRAVPDVVARLAAAGALDDAAFAQSRARKLARTGHSRTAAAAHLAARGVPAELVKTALPADEEGELAAAVTFMRRRRFGPFRAAPADEEARQKELGAMARAGFGGAVARRALALTAAEAEESLRRSRLREP